MSWSMSDDATAPTVILAVIPTCAFAVIVHDACTCMPFFRYTCISKIVYLYIITRVHNKKEESIERAYPNTL